MAPKLLNPGNLQKNISKRTVRLILAGDVMLGRLVGEAILKYGADYPLGEVSETLKNADLTIVNLECALTSSNTRWPGERKAFYFGAPPGAIQSLIGAGIDGVSLANNHTLDFAVEGLFETVNLLRKHHIQFVGAGSNLKEARKPATFKHQGIKFGMVAYCDHQEDFSASEERPGIAYLDLEKRENALDRIREDLSQMKEAKVDWPILSLHWGPNMVRQPSGRFRRFAHEAIDSGYKILFGHSAHLFHGVEIYKECPILYSAGDFVDDYQVDPELRNDHQLFFELVVTGNSLERIFLHPVFIQNCQVVPAGEEAFEYTVRKMMELCEEMGTNVNRTGNRVWINAL